MFKKSLWLILLTALGGFFFSTSAFAGFIFTAYGAGKYCAVSPQAASSSIASDLMSKPNTAYISYVGHRYQHGKHYVQFLQENGVKTSTSIDTDGTCADSDGITEEQALDELDSFCSSLDGQYYSSGSLSEGCLEGTPPDDGNGDGDGDGSGDGSGGGDDGGGSDWQPPTGSECQYASDSEQCCTLYAQDYCSAFGGVYDVGFSNIGGQSCNVTCNDDVTEPDPDPDPDPTPDPDNSDLVNAVNESSNNIASQISDSEAAITGQIAQQTDELGADINSLEATNQSGFDSLNTTNQNGFDSLIQQLEALKNGAGNPDTTFRDSMLDSIDENTVITAKNTQDTVSRLDSTNAELRSINDEIGSLHDSLNGDIQNDDSLLGSFGHGAATGADASVRGALEAQFGDLNKDLPNEQINLSDEADKFDPMLNDVSGSCSSLDESFNFRGKEIKVNLNPVCDVFDVLSYFVIAASLFAVPFIVLGVSKK